MSRIMNNANLINRYLDMKPKATEAAGEEKKTADGKSFGDMLSESVAKVNETQVSADSNMAEFLSGKDNGIHDTMIALEKADISLRLMVQVRNKAVEAYREIMRMQV